MTLTVTTSFPPPLPAPDFQFSFDQPFHDFLQESSPDSASSSSALLSPEETTHLFGFLDNFNFDFDTNRTGPPTMAQFEPPTQSQDVLNPWGVLHAIPQLEKNQTPITEIKDPTRGVHKPLPQLLPLPPPTTHVPTTRPKKVMTEPQKRINHILSEQRRRNAIRDGYAQLAALLAPAGAPPGLGLPTRGRPKGSGTRGKSRPGHGKSGLLLRAVEYCQWLEEERDALLLEVMRTEAAAGIKLEEGL